MRSIFLTFALAACGGGGATGPAMPKLEQGTHRLTIEPGVDVVYDVRGTGRPLCIAHPAGPGLSSEYLHDQALEKRFTMVYIDPLGTAGSSPLPAGQEYSLARDVAVVEALRKQLGLEKACLVGHSYGGMVMLQYAAEHPDRVGALFLYSTTPTNGPDFEREVAAGLARYKDQPFHADATAAMAARDKAPDEATLNALWKRMYPLYFADYLGKRSHYEPLLRATEFRFDPWQRRPVGSKANAFDVRGKLGRLHTTPTVIVAGEQDFSCGPTVAKWLAGAIADSKLIVIPQAGQFAHVEQPTAFDEAVEKFASLIR